jgi:uncharacterized protein
LGNHDHGANPKAVIQTLEESRIIHLGNPVYTLRRGNAMLYIAGVDDIYPGNPDLGMVLKQLPKEGAAILLAQEPDFADTSAATKRFDLQLSGLKHF